MTFKKYLNTIVIFLLVALFTSCKENPKMNILSEVLLPKPVSVKATGSSFELKNNTKILIKGNSEELFQIGKYLANLLKPATGFDLEVKATSKKIISNSIYLIITKLESNYGEEGYHLNITDKNIIIKANNVKGVFRGIQTLRQVFPSEIEASNLQNRKWFIASGEIYDYPQFAYRGAMLDVTRHFFKKEDVKKYIDMIAMYKLNVLHLHLSDDQGWRIEIKSWPNLTTYGGSTQVGGGKGGFYTQDDYKEIVKYAQERYITIIPEIDMPGHTNAALASYPELNCDGKATKLYTGMKVGFSTLCTHKKITYKFVDDVIRELAAITPGPYIHIGGDESHSTKIEDYIPFINKVQELGIAHGKQVIGWDEIVSAAIKPTTIVQYWGRPKNALKGVSKKAKIILSPSDRTYLDMKYDSITKLGLKWAGYVDLDKAYNWNP
ncbi:beta-glycosyl hydrolase, partial [hydrothermal vent metagenome]